MHIRQRIALLLSAGLYRSLSSSHPLLQLFWECTLRCNFNCRHCGSDCKASSSTDDMPFSAFREVLESVRSHTDPHKVSIILSGGEPLSRNDIERCGREIYDMGFPWGMVTNAWGLSRERFKALLSSGMHSLTISLDGMKEDHDWMRGRTGSFERATEAIRMVCAYNAACISGEEYLGFKMLKPGDSVRFDVVSCINRRNINHLEELKQHLVTLGLTNWRLFTVFPVGRAAKDAELQLTGEEFTVLMEFIRRTRLEGKIHASYACEGFLGKYEGIVRDNIFACNAGLTIASVRADGAISGCLSIRSDYNQGNIYKDDFWDVWSNRFIPYRDRKWMKNGRCSSCRYWHHCNGGGMHLRNGEGLNILCRAADSIEGKYCGK